MGHQHHAAFPFLLGQIVAQQLVQTHIQGNIGFVEQDDAGIAHQRPDNGNNLAHPCRQGFRHPLTHIGFITQLHARHDLIQPQFARDPQRLLIEAGIKHGQVFENIAGYDRAGLRQQGNFLVDAIGRVAVQRQAIHHDFA